MTDENSILTEILTPDNAGYYFECGTEDIRLGYMDAVNRVIPALETMLNNSGSFDELKTELQAFVDAQKKLSVFVDENYDQELLDEKDLKRIERMREFVRSSRSTESSGPNISPKP